MNYHGGYEFGDKVCMGIFTDRRWGKDGYIKGINSEPISGAFFLGINSDNHSVDVTYSGYYGNRGIRPYVTQEVYDLAQDNYYNPYYGYQNGKGRNIRSRDYEQNLINLNYSLKVNTKLQVDLSVLSIFGENGYTFPSWFDAMSPYPDYYRYLPDFYSNFLISEDLYEAWSTNDPSVTEINWQRMYETNIYSNPEHGEKRSHYIIAESAKKFFNNSIIAGIAFTPLRQLKLTAGMEFYSGTSSNFSRMKDLMGGDYWLDIDQFILYDEYYGEKAENNLRDPGRKVLEGERFGYDYKIYTDKFNVSGKAEYNALKWKLRGELTIGRTSHQRHGNYEKENFPDYHSFGKSVKKKFNEADLKLSALFSFSLRHYAEASVWIAQKPPLYTEIFFEPRCRNNTVDEALTSQIRSFDIKYKYISPYLSMELIAYCTSHKKGSNIFNYYDDPLSQYVTVALTGIDKIYGGLELSAEYIPTPRFTATLYAAVNISKYNSDADVEISDYNSGSTLLKNGKSMLTGYHLANGPQAVISVEGKYTFPRWWRLGMSLNLAGNNYVSVNPVRRMSRVTDVAASKEVLTELLDQEKLGDAFTVNLTLSKNFRINNGNYIGLWTSVNNILNNRSIIYSGYEQMRLYRTSGVTGNLYYPFPSKYLYAYGINFNISLSYGF